MHPHSPRKRRSHFSVAHTFNFYDLYTVWPSIFGVFFASSCFPSFYQHFSVLLSQLADDELDGSDRELDMDEGGDLSELQWGDSSLPRTSSRPASGTTALTRAERSGRDTPASVDSIPLEWDHDYDLSRGLESPGGRGHRERSQGQEEEDEYLRTAATVLSGQSTFIN